MSPAQYVREVILAEMETLGYKVFVNHLPDKPDKAVVVYDMDSGRLEERLMRSGDVFEHPMVKIMVRGTDYSARGVLEAIWGVMEPVYTQVLSDGKIMRSITKANTIGSLGHEPQTRRCLFTQQFRMTLE